MEEIYVDFFEKLVLHRDNLSKYVDELYAGSEYTHDDLNELFGIPKKEQLITFLPADNRAYHVSITFKGKHYFNENTNSKTKKPKVFISHSSKDQEYVQIIVELLRNIGLNKEQIFCSSIPGFGIDLNAPIVDTLRDQFSEYNLYVLFIHSNNYYDSIIALNEMGAAWALRTEYTSLLLPGFEYSQMRGVFGSDKIAIKLDDYNRSNLKHRLNEMRVNIHKFFGIHSEQDIVWEDDRDHFIERINNITNTAEN